MSATAAGRAAPGRYLVLGATGLVGCHALLALGGAPGVTVRAVRHRRPAPVTPPGVAWVDADLRDPVRARQLMADVDYVLAFAGVVASAPALARDPLAPVLDTLRVTTAVFEAAARAGVRKVVWLGSTTGYPLRDGPLDEDDMFTGEPPPPWSLLGATSRYLETQARCLARLPGARTTYAILRPTMIYGEYDDFSLTDGHFLPAFVRKVVERQRPLEVWGSGEETRDLVYAGDVVDASLRALAVVEGCEAFNVGSGRSRTVNELLRLIVALDGFDDAEVVHVQGRPRSVARCEVATTRARARLGFVAATPLEVGLARTIAWYRDRAAEAAPEAMVTGGEAHAAVHG